MEFYLASSYCERIQVNFVQGCFNVVVLGPGRSFLGFCLTPVFLLGFFLWHFFLILVFVDDFLYNDWGDSEKQHSENLTFRKIDI